MTRESLKARRGHLMAMAFGRLVKELRLRARLTQVQCVAKLGTTQSQYSLAENGKVTPRVFEIDDYASTFRVDPIEFYRMLREYRDQIEGVHRSMSRAPQRSQDSIS